MTFPPGYTTTDILVLCIETANGWTFPLWETNLTNNGWARVANSNTMPGATSVAANAVYQDIWWSRPSTTSQTAVIIGDGGNHTLVVCAAFQGACTTGSPWDTGTSAGINLHTSVETAQVNTMAVTTTTANTLIIAIINKPDDSTAGGINASPLLFSAGANDDTGLTEHCDSGTTGGSGGQIAFLSWRKPTSGLTANLRANTTVANTAILWLGALLASPDSITAKPFSFSIIT
jgi:hypothetical protein